jgi:hypothetical protein
MTKVRMSSGEENVFGGVVDLDTPGGLILREGSDSSVIIKRVYCLHG